MKYLWVQQEFVFLFSSEIETLFLNFNVRLIEKVGILYGHSLQLYQEVMKDEGASARRIIHRFNRNLLQENKLIE